jgi:hypothetical protein
MWLPPRIQNTISFRQVPPWMNHRRHHSTTGLQLVATIPRSAKMAKIYQTCRMSPMGPVVRRGPWQNASSTCSYVLSMV